MNDSDKIKKNNTNPDKKNIEEMNLSADLRMNTLNLQALTENSSDLNIKYAMIGGHNASIIFCEGMVSSETVANLIFRPLNDLLSVPVNGSVNNSGNSAFGANSTDNSKKIEPLQIADMIQNKLLISLEQQQANNYKELCHYIMSGFLVILIEGVDFGMAIGAQGFQYRSVEQVTSHLNLRSSKEGFNEVIRINMSLLRRRIKSPTLVFKMMTLGDRSNTDVCLSYLSDKADKNLVKSIEERLKSIEINTILEGGYLQPFLESENNRILSEIGITERPDTLAAKLYEGRVAVLVDGTPFVMFLPRLFIEHFQTMDDYTGLPIYVTLMRYLKYFAFFLAILLPGLYMALANFHPELFPNSLLFNLLISEQATPYPLLVECIIIHIIYEIMREAGLRLPTYVGHVVSIVGGLVIGQIVVSAGLVGAPIVLIVALASVTSFIIPDLNDSIVILRFMFIFAGGLWGLYGLTLFGMMVMMKFISMSNYGVPFTAPITPFSLKAMRDVIFRAGWRSLVKKDVDIQSLNGVNITPDK